MWRTDSWKRPCCWERLKAGGEGEDRGWDGWTVSLMQWTWVWISSGSWWWTGRPGILQSMGSQRVRHNWATELNWTEKTLKKVFIQFSSVAQSCPTLCDPMYRSTPGLPVHHQLPKFTQTPVHRVTDAIHPSHPRSSPSAPAPNPSLHQSLFQWVNSSHEEGLGLKKIERNVTDISQNLLAPHMVSPTCYQLWSP